MFFAFVRDGLGRFYLDSGVPVNGEWVLAKGIRNIVNIQVLMQTRDARGKVGNRSIALWGISMA